MVEEKKDAFFKKMFLKWKDEIWAHKHLITASLILLIVATCLDYVCGNYVTKVGSALSADLILKFITPIDLNWIFVYLFLITVTILLVYPLFFRVKKLHLTIGHFSLLVMMRSIFMSLTHLKTPIGAIAVRFPGHLTGLVFENDLFFSGHVAIPFLGFLIFKESKIKYFFLASSIILGITSLLMHRHYSIDVFAAFFITYGTYKLGNWAFKKIDKTEN